MRDGHGRRHLRQWRVLHRLRQRRSLPRRKVGRQELRLRRQRVLRLHAELSDGNVQQRHLLGLRRDLLHDRWANVRHELVRIQLRRLSRRLQQWQPHALRVREQELPDERLGKLRLVRCVRDGQRVRDDTCSGDNGCVATAWCGANTCKSKVALGGACSAEPAGDHECASPYVCSWNAKGNGGFCVTTRCTGCAAAYSTGNCGDFIAYGYDPRGACQGYSATSCHQNYCAGQSGDPLNPNPPSCDLGLDQVGANWRTCGAVTCTNNAAGAGVRTGTLCQPSNTCQSGKTDTPCGDVSGRICFPCNAAHNDCDYNAGFSC